MTARVRGWLAGVAALSAIGGLWPATAWACFTDGDCQSASPDAPICSGFMCVPCTSSLQCIGLGHAGPNCELSDGGAQGSCFDCTKEMQGQACPPSAPVCESFGGICIPGSVPDSGGPDADAAAPPADAAAEAGDSGSPAAPDAGDAGVDASTPPSDAATDALPSSDATIAACDTGNVDAGDYGNAGLIEGGACSCDLPGGPDAGLGAGGFAIAIGLLVSVARRRSTT